MTNSAIQQYSYHKWANNRIFDHLKTLPAEVYDTEIKSVFSSIQEVLIHSYITEGMWLSVMAGDNFSETMEMINELKEKSNGGSLPVMEQLCSDMNETYFDFLNSHADLDRKFTIKHPEFGDLEASVTDMVNHVVNHGTYHRGNLTAMLRQQGHAGVSTDYIFYLYEV